MSNAIEFTSGGDVRFQLQPMKIDDDKEDRSRGSATHRRTRSVQPIPNALTPVENDSTAIDSTPTTALTVPSSPSPARRRSPTPRTPSTPKTPPASQLTSDPAAPSRPLRPDPSLTDSTAFLLDSSKADSGCDQGHDNPFPITPSSSSYTNVSTMNNDIKSHHQMYKSSTLEEKIHRPTDSRATKRSINIVGADEMNETWDVCGLVFTIIALILVIITFPFSLCVTLKVVQEYERAVIFRLGRLLSGGAKGPGIFFVLPCIENYTKVDLRTVTFDVPPQEVLTKDSVTVSVDAVVYCRVNNPTISVANVENAHHSTRLLAQTTLRNVMGTKDLTEILSDREGISALMQETLDKATDQWGIMVERLEIKDVRLPVQLQRAMAAEAEAAREARAKVIAAEGEQKASRALKEASEVISEAPSALQLRYLQTLNSISAEKNSTIIFPVPIDLMTSFGAAAK